MVLRLDAPPKNVAQSSPLWTLKTKNRLEMQLFCDYGLSRVPLIAD